MWGAPRYVVPRDSSIGVVPLRVLTRSAPPARVLNIAHGASFSVFPNPTLWLAVAVNVARNSSDRPGANVPVVRAHAPSTCSDPPLTVASPPAASTDDAKPVGNDVPPNSDPAAGARITSPSPVWAT